MTSWGYVFLGAIAISTVLMALIQVGAIVFAAKLARRVDRLADRVEHEMKPVMASMTAVGNDAARLSALAVSQMQRADQAVSNLTQRADATLNVVQSALTAPARESLALITGLKAAVAEFRNSRDEPRGHGRGEDEDALFI